MSQPTLIEPQATETSSLVSTSAIPEEEESAHESKPQHYGIGCGPDTPEETEARKSEDLISSLNSMDRSDDSSKGRSQEDTADTKSKQEDLDRNTEYMSPPPKLWNRKRFFNNPRQMLQERVAPWAVMRKRGNPNRNRPRGRFVVPLEHPFKLAWDILTIVLSIASAYATHVSIHQRKFEYSPFVTFCDIWFLVDILLTFVTERKTADGELLRDHRSICARYLTSGFAVDALALCPWERWYVQPIIEIQNQRGFFQKSFFRSKAVVRITSHLRGKHFRWFGTVVKHSKQHGIGASRLLRLIIKYVPKYVMFFRNMKGVVAVRVIRQFQWFRRFYKNFMIEEKSDAKTGSITRDDFEDDLSSQLSNHGDLPQRKLVQLVYEDWELMDDDDDGVPL